MPAFRWPLSRSGKQRPRTALPGQALNWRFGKDDAASQAGHWHAHEGRHTAVSIMSSNGVPLKEISDIAGTSAPTSPRPVYRHAIMPAIRGGASVMDTVFGHDPEDGSGAAKVAG